MRSCLIASETSLSLQQQTCSSYRVEKYLPRGRMAPFWTVSPGNALSRCFDVMERPLWRRQFHSNESSVRTKSFQRATSARLCPYGNSAARGSISDPSRDEQGNFTG